MEKVTTIKLRRETKKRLDRLKEHPRESYEEVLRKILFILNLSRKNPEKASKMFGRLDAVVRRKGNKYTVVYSDDTSEDIDVDESVDEDLERSKGVEGDLEKERVIIKKKKGNIKNE
jgi:hypothetical protein